MALRQAHRTGKTPLPDRLAAQESPLFSAVPYAFAVRIEETGVLGTTYRRIVVIRCPWCGDEHNLAIAYEQRLDWWDQAREASCGWGDIMPHVPAGTPVMVTA